MRCYSTCMLCRFSLWKRSTCSNEEQWRATAHWSLSFSLCYTHHLIVSLPPSFPIKPHPRLHHSLIIINSLTDWVQMSIAKTDGKTKRWEKLRISTFDVLGNIIIYWLLCCILSSTKIWHMLCHTVHCHTALICVFITKSQEGILEPTHTVNVLLVNTAYRQIYLSQGQLFNLEETERKKRTEKVLFKLLYFTFRGFCCTKVIHYCLTPTLALLKYI